MFERCLIDEEGDIPEIFRMNMLRSDSQSSLSRLMDEIDRHQPEEEEEVDQDADDAAVEEEIKSSPNRLRGKKKGRRSRPSESSYGSGSVDRKSNNKIKSARYSLASAPEKVGENRQRHPYRKQGS